jgi:phosphatidylethanolamine/phosphatidyl-N-methylethanolamine N-methyltransferase
MSELSTSKSVERAYRAYAPIYDQLFGAVLGHGRKALARAVIGLKPATLLEVGIGTGLMLDLYPEGTRLTGIDLSPHMLARAQARAHALANREIHLELADAEKMAFPDASFDCVTLPYVLSVTPDPARLVAEVRRVCKKGGHIIVLNHFSGSPFWWLLERGVRSVADRVGFRSDFVYEEHILTHDWQVESVQSVNLFGLSKLVVLRNV